VKPNILSLTFLSVMISSCTSARTSDETAASWSWAQDIAHFDGAAPDLSFENELIYTPFRYAVQEERHVAIMRTVADRLRGCDRFVVVHRTWDVGASLDGGWLCERSGARSLRAGKFWFDEEMRPVVESIGGASPSNLDAAIALLSGLDGMDVTNFTTMDGASAIATYSENGTLFRRSKYDPYEAHFDGLARKSASEHKGFDRFYVGFVRIIEGTCRDDCM
jgi:hypothetical protein